MSKFGKKISKQQSIPTSALPDIIFILLFFFMVATNVREQKEDLVGYEEPEATQLTTLNKNLTRFYIKVGPPKDEGKYGTTPRIQMNGALITPKEIPQIINTNIQELREKKSKAKVYIILTVDADAPEGIVNDVEEQLKEVDTRNIVYSAESYGTGKKLF